MESNKEEIITDLLHQDSLNEKIVAELKNGNSQSLMTIINKCPAVNCLLQKDFQSLYWCELRDHLRMTGKLTSDDVVNSVRSINVVGAVSKVVDNDESPQDIWKTIQALDKHLHHALLLPEETDINVNIVVMYLKIKHTKRQNEKLLLTLDDVHDALEYLEVVKEAVVCIQTWWRKQRRKKLCLFVSKDSSSECCGRPILEEDHGEEISDVPVILNFTPQNNNFSHIPNFNGNDLMNSYSHENSMVHLSELPDSSQVEAVSSPNQSYVPVSSICDELATVSSSLCCNSISSDVPESALSMPVPLTIREGSESIPDVSLSSLPHNFQSICDNSSVNSSNFLPNDTPDTSPEKSTDDRVCIVPDVSQVEEAHQSICVEPMITNEDNTEQDNKALHTVIEELRGQVVETIKRNEDLCKCVENIDLKIGLLVRNRSNTKEMLHTVPTPISSGIKHLSQQGKVMRDHYQRLLYLLQTRPEYLSRLLMTSPNSKAVQQCVMNLFNMGSTHREHFLLLKLLAVALKTEIAEKFVKPTDAITGDSAVLRMTIGLARQAGHHPLKTVLSPFVKQILEETRALETNPVDIYHRWINETNNERSLPACVSEHTALSYPQVREILEQNIKRLTSWVYILISRLKENVHKIPYTMKYISKTLRDTLHEKFTQLSEKDSIKIIGNVIFYQFVNSAIVAPDAFQIIKLGAKESLRPFQRNNLASIAKILQLSSSKNGFGDDYSHLKSLNPFIIECHETIKKMSAECCLVPEPDVNFHVSAYSEALLVSRPRLYITAQELCDCHALVEQHRDVIAPNADDPLRQLLMVLPPPPTPNTLMAAKGPHVGNMLLCLELDTGAFVTLSSQNTCSQHDDLLENQLKERRELELTLERLQEKGKYYMQQLEYYKEYLNTCLVNLTNTNDKCRRRVKYTGADLSRKGVIIKMDTLLTSQLNSMHFVISTTKVHGTFRVSCTFRGVDVETTHIHLQDLLALQFEGQTSIKMFGKIELSVDLFINLINHKFMRRKCK